MSPFGVVIILTFNINVNRRRESRTAVSGGGGAVSFLLSSSVVVVVVVVVVYNATIGHAAGSLFLSKAQKYNYVLIRGIRNFF